MNSLHKSSLEKASNFLGMNPETIALLKNYAAPAGIGAGVGALGMGAADAFGEHGKDENRMESLLKSMALGGVLGGGAGLAVQSGRELFGKSPISDAAGKAVNPNPQGNLGGLKNPLVKSTIGFAGEHAGALGTLSGLGTTAAIAKRDLAAYNKELGEIGKTSLKAPLNSSIFSSSNPNMSNRLKTKLYNTVPHYQESVDAGKGKKILLKDDLAAQAKDKRLVEMQRQIDDFIGGNQGRLSKAQLEALRKSEVGFKYQEAFNKLKKTNRLTQSPARVSKEMRDLLAYNDQIGRSRMATVHPGQRAFTTAANWLYSTPMTAAHNLAHKLTGGKISSPYTLNGQPNKNFNITKVDPRNLPFGAAGLGGENAAGARSIHLYRPTATAVTNLGRTGNANPLYGASRAFRAPIIGSLTGLGLGLGSKQLERAILPSDTLSALEGSEKYLNAARQVFENTQRNNLPQQ